MWLLNVTGTPPFGSPAGAVILGVSQGDTVGPQYTLTSSCDLKATQDLKQWGLDSPGIKVRSGDMLIEALGQSHSVWGEVAQRKPATVV